MRILYFLTLSAVAIASAVAQTPEPSAFELEVWRAASRLDTVDAYKEYLSKFPNGGFVSLARQAIDKLSLTSRRQDTVTVGSLDPLLLNALRSQIHESGATYVRPGDRFIGPGILTVGWLGAKKQIVLPRGEWVALAAFDHTLSSFISVHYTTLALGQFAGSELQALLVITSTSKSLPPQGGTVGSMVAAPLPAVAEGCVAKRPDDLHYEALSLGAVNSCALVRALTPGDAYSRVPQGLQERVSHALRVLRGTQSPFSSVAELHLTDRRQTYVGYSLHTAASATMPDSVPASTVVRPQVTAAALAVWLKSVRPYAAAGFSGRFGATDLVPGQAPLEELPLLP